jgi:hypothetical protein
MGRGLIALCAVALLVPGCGGGGDATAQGGGRPTAGARDAGWASRAEVSWLADVADWSAGFAEAGSAVFPATYCSSECRDGGELDLDEGSPQFP